MCFHDDKMRISFTWNMHFHYIVLIWISIIWKCVLTLIWGLVDSRLSDKCCLADLPMKDITQYEYWLSGFSFSTTKQSLQPCSPLAYNRKLQKFPRRRTCTWHWESELGPDTPWWLHTNVEHLYRSLNICTEAWSTLMIARGRWNDCGAICARCFLLSFMLFRSPTPGWKFYLS